MHLDYQTSRYKDKVYKYYHIAEAYREGGKVKKNRLFHLGTLSDEQAKKIRLILKVVSYPDEQVTTLANIVAQECVNYLDVAVVNQLWESWQLSEAFTFDITRGDLSTDLVAKVLTINRCLDPCSHYSVPGWIRGTALPDILGEQLLDLNDDKIYYELSKIEKNKLAIEYFLFKKTYEQDPKSYDYVNYDLSTSYFVGLKCKLSAFGISKDGKRNCKQVILALMINSRGYPFKWDVFPGNMPEIDTMDKVIRSCAHRFKLKDISMVFDRGLVSEENLNLIEDKNLKYITALDTDQIPNVPVVDLKVFKDLDSDTALERIPQLPGFTKFDSSLYYLDLGVEGKRRYVVGINPEKFMQDRQTRKEKMDCFRHFIAQANRSLKRAKRDRKANPTRNKFFNELKRLKIKKYYEDPQLKEIYVNITLKSGERKQVRSFQVKVKEKKQKIAKEKLTDGLCMFVTNHVKKEQEQYLFPSKRIIEAYREKTQVEDAFKNIKSFVKIRPFFVNKDEHVKAVYTICVLSYFINRYLSEQRKESEGKDYLNSKQLYAPFKSCKLVTLIETLAGITKKDIIPLSEEQRSILRDIVPEKNIKFEPTYSSIK
ncbi:MAG: IS1634 family transposase [Deltaproteobacteria bacterium]|nr:IS1634 family transposase [Deltaproteobacteria bacterium]